ncbi:MAG: alpha/beta hydrolase [Chloroflexi bacterium]|nr:alpha/beta hydrolase [Chloroflexota bacterium]
MDDELKQFEVKGQTIFAKEAGREKRPIALLIHGWSSSWYAMSPMFAPLQRKYRILAVDLPGYGRSPTLLEKVTMTKYADLLADLIRSQSSKPAVLIGHSMGGMISLTMALRHPDVVERMVLLCPTITGKLSLFINLYVSPLTFVEKYRLLNKIGSIIDPYILGLVDRLMRPAAFSERSAISDKEYARLRSDVRRPGQGRVRAECFWAMREGNLSGQLQKIDKPSLVIWGMEDNTVPLRDASLLASEWEDVDLRIMPNVSHWPQFEATETINRYTTAFLSIPLKLLTVEL